METNKSPLSPIEILEVFAKKTNREISFTETAYVKHTSRYQHYLRRLYIPNKINSDVHFVSFLDQKRIDEFANFSGIFFPISVPLSSKIEIRKKNILDKLNPFFKKSGFETGNEEFDSGVVISENVSFEEQEIFNNRKIQKHVLKIFELNEILKITINQANINFVPFFEGKSHIGIIVTRHWLLDSELIQNLFYLMEQFRKEF